MNYAYLVFYQIDGTDYESRFYTSNPGAAFAACLKRYPKATLFKATVEGLNGGYMEYYPPPVDRVPQPPVRPARELKHNERGCEFDFYDKVKG